MANYIEYGVGFSKDGTDAEKGRIAASKALSGVKRFSPTFALAFIPAECDVPQVHFGIIEVLGECPLLGTSTAGEIVNAELSDTVVVLVMATSHMWVHVGMGHHVSKDYRKATDDALRQADILDYFKPGHYLNHMLSISGSGGPAAPMLMILFTPGATSTQYSLSHEIHTYLRKMSMNRIPIFGGSSADQFLYHRNYQIANHHVATDSVAVALIESEILFGFGMAHGFTRGPRQVVVTRAEGHIVHEINDRPAAEVFSELLNVPLSRLSGLPVPLTNYPFGMHDIYGNSLLLVPERLLEGGGIQFAPMMRNNQAITPMDTNPDYLKKSYWRAYQKAIRQGGIKKPLFALLFACALRRNLIPNVSTGETEYLKNRTTTPFYGFYTYGEQGLSDDGLPIYSNQSVSTLVFSDALNPLATLIQTRKQIYSDVRSVVETKVTQIKSIKNIGKIVHNSTSVSGLLPLLINELKRLLPWADAAFYLNRDEYGDVYSIASASNFERFDETIRDSDIKDKDFLIWLGSKKKHFGALLLKQKHDSNPPGEEDLLMAEIAGQLAAGGCKKLDVKSRLEVKLNHIEILKQLGSELAYSMTTNARYGKILRHIRKTLGLSFATLWLLDRPLNIIIKEAMDADESVAILPDLLEADEKIASWQMINRKPYFCFKNETVMKDIDIMPSFHLSFISLPIMKNKEMIGVLNFYSRSHYRWFFQKDYMAENIDFLMSVSAQMSVFIENRALYQHKTLNKEIHHRVKNNLQNIASLLRMQARRVRHQDAKVALESSISRIMSIAMVHQTLSLTDIEKVDIVNLANKIYTLATSEMGDKPIITLETSGPETLLPSKFATSLALVLNELIQNAVKYGTKNNEEAEVRLKIDLKEDDILITVHDTGPGFPKDFDLTRDSNMGLTIVSTLIQDELKGEYKIESINGAKVSLKLPVPKIQPMSK